VKKSKKKGATQKPAPGPPARQRTLPTWVVLLLIVLLGGLLYANTLDVPFIFDDETSIRDNPSIRWSAISLANLSAATRESPAPHRPLAYASFALNHMVHGYRLPGYHLVNMAVHILAGIFLFLLIRRTLALPLFRGRYRRPDLLALFAALLWFVNPLQTQSVTYVVQRMNSMAAMFTLLALLLYLQGRTRIEDGLPGWPWFTGCAAAGLLGCATKEIAATLPLAILLYEYFFLQDLDRSWLRRAVPWIGVLLAVTLVLALVFLGSSPVQRIQDSYEFRDFTMGQRLLTQPRVVLQYLTLFVVPHPSRLNLDHHVETSTSLLQPVSTLPSLLALAGLLIAAAWLARRHRLLAFTIFWFLGNLVIESSAIALEMMFEHRAYMPTMLVPLALLSLCWPRTGRTTAAVVVLTLLTLVLSAWTIQRNATWTDRLTLWQDVVRKSPYKLRAHNNLSALAIDLNRSDLALQHAGQAIQIAPGNADAHYNHGTALLRAGRLEEAAASLQEALRHDPLKARAHTNLGGIRFQQGNLERAMACWEAALAVDPDDVLANHNCAVQYENRGEYDRAIIHFRRYLARETGAVKIRLRVAALLERQGWAAEAADEYRRILAEEPNNNEARAWLDALGERSR